MEDLRRVVGRTVRATFGSECGCDLVHRVLVVREGTPVGSVNDEDGEGESCMIVNIVGGCAAKRDRFDILFPRTNSARPAITIAIHPKK